METEHRLGTFTDRGQCESGHSAFYSDHRQLPKAEADIAETGGAPW
jgi:hypothetical protein